MQFYLSGAVADRGIGPADYPRERLDTIFGSIFCNIISMAIIVATAAAITHRGPLESAAQAALALEPVAGPSRRDFSRSASSARPFSPPRSFRSPLRTRSRKP